MGCHSSLVHITGNQERMGGRTVYSSLPFYLKAYYYLFFSSSFWLRGSFASISPHSLHLVWSQKYINTCSIKNKFTPWPKVFGLWSSSWVTIKHITDLLNRIAIYPVKGNLNIYLIKTFGTILCIQLCGSSLEKALLFSWVTMPRCTSKVYKVRCGQMSFNIRLSPYQCYSE